MSRKTPRSPVQARSAARLAAVQALYDAEITGASADTLLKDFVDHKIGSRALVTGADEVETEMDLAPADPLLLAAVLRGALERAEQLDQVVGQALTGDWHVERLESVLHAILRAGAFELTAMPETPARVVISEYVDVASAFYSGPEPGLVNAVLDRIARVVRTAELGGDGRSR
jgi:N utilization substance protein B